MALTKNQLATAKGTYEIYWDSYMVGDLETFASTLDEDFEMIGTSESEVAHNKAEGIAFYMAQMEEVVGKAAMRNRQITAKPLDDMVLINEACDIYVLGEPDLNAVRQDWTFYSKIRISTLLHETNTGWKVIQQHGSLPDMRVKEGETLALEKITKENLVLRDAVKRRTIELEQKNRELEIEAALERVRAVAMGMKKPEDMLDICRIISEQLQQFGVEKIRNIQTAIIDEEKGIYLCYQYFTPYDKVAVERTEYLKSPVEHGMVSQMLASKDGHFTGTLAGKELDEFREHRKAENHFPDPLLDKAKELNYCFLSIGQGGLGLTLYQPIDGETLGLFTRFHQVFSLAYSRFQDIEKAQARAREVEIELALERVRAMTMAMHNSEDVGKCVVKMFAELTALGVDEGTRFGIGILNQDNENNQLWTARKDGEEVNLHIGHLDMSWHPLLKSAREAWKAQVPIHKYVLEGEDLLDYYRMLNKAPDYKIQIPLDKLPKKEIQHCFIFEHGFFYAFTPLEFQPDLIQITKRFSSLFEQTYRRYLDLVRAEAQAREAQIEYALEKVRSRTMSMQRSDELTDVARLLFEQVSALGIKTWTAGFNVWSEDNNSYVDYLSLNGEIYGPNTVYTEKAEALKELRNARKSGVEFDILYVEGEKIKQLYLAISGIDENEYDLMVKDGLLPSQQYEHFVFGAKVSVMFITYEPVPEAHDIFKRLGKVFEQTYTRFLDLQKAEEQVREAQIEAALERIRARAMAMHHSGELKDVLTVLFNQFDILGIKPVQAQLSLFDLENNKFTFRSTGKKGRGNMAEQVIDMDAMDTWKETIDSWKASKPKSISTVYFPKETLPQLWALFDEVRNQLPEDDIITEEDFPDGVYVTEGNFKYGYIGFSHNRKATPEEEEIVIKIATEFGRLYQRFLDLQTAEAQAREAQIQLSLERIRSKAMAMQHSDELSDFLTVVFEQFHVLNLRPVTSQLSFLDIDKNRSIFRMTGKNGATLIATQEIDLDASPFWKQKVEDFKSGQPNDVDVLFIPNDMLPEIVEILKEILAKLPEDERPLPEDYPNGQYIVEGTFKYGYLGYSATGPPSDEEKEITHRIANEFGNVYQRFLDLEKAEAQARESEIELALERVRARTMAMQHSDELTEASEVLDQQVRSLGIETWGCAFHIYTDDPEGDYEWFSSREGTLPFYKTPRENFFLKFFEKGKAGELFHVEEFSGEDCRIHYDYLMTIPVMGEALREIVASGASLPESQYDHIAFFKHGYILFITYKPVRESYAIFQRFAKVFEQTYTRFLDLQKAEAQAREAKIEVALEKVRSRTMGMQKSDELADVANVLFQEMNELVHNLWTCGFVLCEKDRAEDEWWLSLEDGFTRGFFLPNVNDYAHAHLYEGWLKKDDFRTAQLEGDQLLAHYDWLMEIPIAKSIFDDMEAAGMQRPEWQKLHAAYFSKGYLVIITREPCPEEAIFKRFAQVFDLTYTRFLDLKKAEEQARESQIEASLEKVRSRSLAMQSPAELIEVAQLLREEMGALGVEELETSSIYIHDENSGLTQCWFTIKNTNDPSKAVTDQMTIDLQDTWVGRQMLDFYRSPENQTSILMQGANRIAWIQYCEEKTDLFGTSNFYGDIIPERTYHLYKFSNGYIGAAAPGEISKEIWDLLKRATAVFSFAYTRFQDLQKAEASALAAMRQASLDRIRADISSMRHADDLDRITPLIFKELTVLGVPFIRCGVFIIQEKEEIVEAYLSSPDGNSLGVLKLPYQASELTYQTVKAWRKGEVYRQHWNKEDFMQWIEQLMAEDQIQDSNTYQGTAAPPESLNLHFVPFTQGMLYVGAVSPLDDKELELVQALAKAFAIAFARYEDFVKLEQAKAEVESAMSELKATQSQLVQQEKLASLGQLTAGIAHEIKNPLNFVNNFSEVSMELIEEAREERSKNQEARDETLVDEILEDIKSNLTKIHEHGTRANSIVSSMLQHSRGGSGKMEPTDLNALIKEYVNLSFHGMRAGKNPLDVDIVLDLASGITDIPLIKEDFTRVVINLCNNAFDAMRGKVYQTEDGRRKTEDNSSIAIYDPRLKVTTSLEKGQVQIAIQDNGPGIPDEIKDKILQPFFTTKKGTEGTGLGLSITHDIVKAHGGEIHVKSKLGEFTTFEILLPM